MSSSSSKGLRILLYVDDGEKHPAVSALSDSYNMMMMINVAESPWIQVEEMLTMAGVKISGYAKSSIHIDVEGTLGLKSVAYVKDLATRGMVTWYIDEASVAPLRTTFGPSAAIMPLPTPSRKGPKPHDEGSSVSSSDSREEVAAD